MAPSTAAMHAPTSGSSLARATSSPALGWEGENLGVAEGPPAGKGALMRQPNGATAKTWTSRGAEGDDGEGSEGTPPSRSPHASEASQCSPQSLSFGARTPDGSPAHLLALLAPVVVSSLDIGDASRSFAREETGVKVSTRGLASLRPRGARTGRDSAPAPGEVRHAVAADAARAWQWAGAAGAHPAAAGGAGPLPPVRVPPRSTLSPELLRQSQRFRARAVTLGARPARGVAAERVAPPVIPTGSQSGSGAIAQDASAAHAALGVVAPADEEKGQHRRHGVAARSQPCAYGLPLPLPAASTSHSAERLRHRQEPDLRHRQEPDRPSTPTAMHALGADDDTPGRTPRPGVHVHSHTQGALAELASTHGDRAAGEEQEEWGEGDEDARDGPASLAGGGCIGATGGRAPCSPRGAEAVPGGTEGARPLFLCELQSRASAMHRRAPGQRATAAQADLDSDQDSGLVSSRGTRLATGVPGANDRCRQPHQHRRDARGQHPRHAASKAGGAVSPGAESAQAPQALARLSLRDVEGGGPAAGAAPRHGADEYQTPPQRRSSGLAGPAVPVSGARPGEAAEEGSCERRERSSSASESRTTLRGARSPLLAPDEAPGGAGGGGGKEDGPLAAAAGSVAASPGETPVPSTRSSGSPGDEGWAAGSPSTHAPYLTFLLAEDADAGPRPAPAPSPPSPRGQNTHSPGDLSARAAGARGGQGLRGHPGDASSQSQPQSRCSSPGVPLSDADVPPAAPEHALELGLGVGSSVFRHLRDQLRPDRHSATHSAAHLTGHHPLVRPPPLDTLAPLGVGATSCVSLVRDARTRRLYALKTLPKALLVADGLKAKRNVQRALRERDALVALQGHPCLVELHTAFSDESGLHLLTEALLGGDLHTLLCECGALTDAAVAFYASAVAVGLGALHALGCAFRDVKAENVALDHNGWPRLVDLGGVVRVDDGALAPVPPPGRDPEGDTREERTVTRFGTVEYMSPEMVSGAGRGGRGPGTATDWWSLGALVFELLVGRTPCATSATDGDALAIATRIRDGQVLWPGEDETQLAGEALDLLSQLLCKDEAKRLGAGAADEKAVLAHPFLAAVDTDALVNRCGIEPPFRPHLHGPADTRRFAHVNGEAYKERRRALKPLSGDKVQWEIQFANF